MKISLNRILFPTDFSPASECARDYACTIAGLIKGELHVMHVVEAQPPHPAKKVSRITLHETLPVKTKHEVETRLVQLMEGSSLGDSRVIHGIRIGNPAQEIVKYASRNKIDLIILGTHGRTGLSHLLIGSVAEKVIRMSQCPVLTIPPSGNQLLLDLPKT